MLDPQVIKSREIVAGFKENNARTIYKRKEYDSKLKLWKFEPIQVDERAKQYHESITKTQKQIADEARAKRKTKKEKKETETARAKREVAEFRNQVMILKNQGLSKIEIKAKLNATLSRVAYHFDSLDRCQTKD